MLGKIVCAGVGVGVVVGSATAWSIRMMSCMCSVTSHTTCSNCTCTCTRTNTSPQHVRSKERCMWGVVEVRVLAVLSHKVQQRFAFLFFIMPFYDDQRNQMHFVLLL